MAIASSSSGSTLRVAFVSALLAAGAGLLYRAPTPDPPYLMVDEVVARTGELDGARLRVHGWVHAGSIVRVAPELTTFLLQRHGADLRVWHAGPLPDTFKDQSELVAYGTLSGELLEAEQLMAKCATKYEGGAGRGLTTVYK